MKVPIDKFILVIGGTDAQGLAVVKALLEPTSDRASSPYALRPNVHVMELDRPDDPGPGNGPDIPRGRAVYHRPSSSGVFSKVADRWASID